MFSRIRFAEKHNISLTISLAYQFHIYLTINFVWEKSTVPWYNGIQVATAITCTV